MSPVKDSGDGTVHHSHFIAENIATIHDRVEGDLSHKIDDLHRIIMSIANRCVHHGSDKLRFNFGAWSDNPLLIYL